MVHETNLIKFEPFKVFAANKGFDVKPMEARFLKISLQIPPGKDEVGPYPGPLTMYFTKDSFALNND